MLCPKHGRKLHGQSLNSYWNQYLLSKDFSKNKTPESPSNSTKYLQKKPDSTRVGGLKLISQQLMSISKLFQNLLKNTPVSVLPML